MIGEENILMIMLMVFSVYLALRRTTKLRVDGIGDGHITMIIR